MLAFILPAFPYIWADKDSLQRPPLGSHPDIAALVTPFLPCLDTLIFRQAIVSLLDERVAIRWADRYGRRVSPPAEELPLPYGYVAYDGPDDPSWIDADAPPSESSDVPQVVLSRPPHAHPPSRVPVRVQTKRLFGGQHRPFGRSFVCATCKLRVCDPMPTG